MRVKRWIALALAVCLCCLLAACGSKQGKETETGGEADSPVTKCATIGEAKALDGIQDEATGLGQTAFVLAFELNGSYWRLTADLTQAQSDEIDALDMMADDYQEKYTALTNALAVTKCENLDAQRLTDAQMQALAGKTGQALLDDGWTIGAVYNTETMEFELEYADFAYSVAFEAAGPIENTDDFDVAATIGPLTVKAVTFSGIGVSATDVPDEPFAEPFSEDATA